MADLFVHDATVDAVASTVAGLGDLHESDGAVIAIEIAEPMEKPVQEDHRNEKTQ